MGSTVSSRNTGRIAPMDRWKFDPAPWGSLGVGLPLISGDVFVGCKNWFIEKMDDIYLQYSFWGWRWGMSCSERSYGKSQNVINMKDFSHQTGMTTWRLASCCKFFQDNFSLGSQLYQHLTEVSLPWRICSGLLAGSTAALAANPADVVLIRMQADSGWPTACLGHPPWSWHMAHGVGENTKLWVACWWTFGGKFSLALVIPPPRSLQNWLCTDTPSPLGNPLRMNHWSDIRLKGFMFGAPDARDLPATSQPQATSWLSPCLSWP